jgi:hypothetical protein
MGTSKQRELDDAVDVLTDGWVSVHRIANKEAYAAWLDWRKKEMKSFIEPEYFTVPDYFPPSSAQAAKEYITAVKAVRRAIQWPAGVAKLPSHPSPWYGS